MHTWFKQLIKSLQFYFLVFPETEGITLEDIELHFSDDSKKLTDHKIIKPRRDSNGVLLNKQLLIDLKDVKVVENNNEL